mmetsp:Transcript_45923/g.128033  ORF Transcript_45923/g.128033 Transcript_45923/m.128033 type:complete len:204 (+) Transcript_45923:300-911(+)
MAQGRSPRSAGLGPGSEPELALERGEAKGVTKALLPGRLREGVCAQGGEAQGQGDRLPGNGERPGGEALRLSALPLGTRKGPGRACEGLPESPGEAPRSKPKACGASKRASQGGGRCSGAGAWGAGNPASCRTRSNSRRPKPRARAPGGCTWMAWQTGCTFRISACVSSKNTASERSTPRSRRSWLTILPLEAPHLGELGVER